MVTITARMLARRKGERERENVVLNCNLQEWRVGAPVHIAVTRLASFERLSAAVFSFRRDPSCKPRNKIKRKSFFASIAVRRWYRELFGDLTSPFLIPSEFGGLNSISDIDLILVSVY